VTKWGRTVGRRGKKALRRFVIIRKGRMIKFTRPERKEKLNITRRGELDHHRAPMAIRRGIVVCRGKKHGNAKGGKLTIENSVEEVRKMHNFHWYDRDERGDGVIISRRGEKRRGTNT